MIWGYIIIALILLPITIWSLSTGIGLLLARGVPYVPLKRKQLDVIKKNIQLDKTDIVVDLGCGDSRVLRLFEKQGITNLTGFEINFWAYLKGFVVNSLLKSKAKMYYKNFFNENLSRYNVVFCYLLQGCLERLKSKFDKELRPGAIVISFAFPIKNWRDPEIIYTDSKKNLNRIFIYHI